MLRCARLPTFCDFSLKSTSLMPSGLSNGLSGSSFKWIFLDPSGLSHYHANYASTIIIVQNVSRLAYLYYHYRKESHLTTAAGSKQSVFRFFSRRRPFQIQPSSSVLFRQLLSLLASPHGTCY